MRVQSWIETQEPEAMLEGALLTDPRLGKWAPGPLETSSNQRAYLSTNSGQAVLDRQEKLTGKVQARSQVPLNSLQSLGGPSLHAA